MREREREGGRAGGGVRRMPFSLSGRRLQPTLLLLVMTRLKRGREGGRLD